MKKFVSVILALALVMISVAAFADTLVMCTNASFPPYEYVEGDDFAGIDVDIFREICARLGYDAQIDDMEFSSCIPAVQSGKADMALAGMTVTEERQQLINFSDSYAQGVQVIIVREDSEITCLDDLFTEGKNWQIGVQMATTGDIYALDDFDGKTGTVQEYQTGNEAAMALVAGKIDCVIIDNEPAKNYVAANEGLKILDTAYTVEDYAIAISKDKPELLEQVNATLADMKADGTVDAIVAKYINAD